MSERARPGLGPLALTFLKLGATAFGGPAAADYIRREAVDRRHWLDSREFDEGVALCQMIPGATAMQTAAYTGLIVRGIPGAAVAFTAFGLPAFILMLTLAAVYAEYRALPLAAALFRGMGAIVVAIVANATWSFAERYARDLKRALIAVAAGALFAWGMHPFLIVALAAVAGLMLTVPPQEAGQIHASPRWTALGLPAAAACVFSALFVADRPLFDLAALMFRIDLFAFGGGFASVPLMLHEVVSVRHWLDDATFRDGIVLGQITPGPIVITATFVGYLLRGPAGAAAATAGIFLPSFLLVVGVAPYVRRFRASPLFCRLAAGALCSFVGLLLNVTLHFATRTRWDTVGLLLAGGAFAALRLGVSMVRIVLAGAILSAALCILS